MLSVASSPSERRPIVPRKWLLTVKQRPGLADGKTYQAEVVSVARNAKPAGIEVTLSILDKSQAGRKEKVLLPLPVFGDGLASDFFRACGLSVRVGQEVDPAEAIGKDVRARFHPRADDDGCEAVSFEPVSTKRDTSEQHPAHAQQKEATEMRHSESSPASSEKTEGSRD